MQGTFDPDAAAAPGSGLFGLTCGPEEARAHVLAVPFDATTSYRRGAAEGPAAIAAASHQVDLYDRLFGKPYQQGIWLHSDDGTVAAWNREARTLADPIIAAGGHIAEDPELARNLQRVNELGGLLNDHVRSWTETCLAEGRLPFLLGGDHAVPFGSIAACAERHPGLGLLHIDAHADLREAYEGFTWSHASILFNALERLPQLGPVLQVGIRDLGEREAQRQTDDPRLHVVFDDDWAQARMTGGNLLDRVRQAIRVLPPTVYVTIDVDGLDPALCPNTGTPVPGGLQWAECMLWLTELAASGRRVVGADLVEVSPGPSPDPDGEGWDAVVGARLLYRLIGMALRSSPLS